MIFEAVAVLFGVFLHKFQVSLDVFLIAGDSGSVCVRFAVKGSMEGYGHVLCFHGLFCR